MRSLLEGNVRGPGIPGVWPWGSQQLLFQGLIYFTPSWLDVRAVTGPFV